MINLSFRITRLTAFNSLLASFMICLPVVVCGSQSTVTLPASAQSLLVDVFPESDLVLPDDEVGNTRLSSVYTPSESIWGRGLNETDVFHFEIRHLQGADNSFTARLGRGGQLYSLRGPFGESIPPQGVGNPWNDEVWQFVAVCSSYNGTINSGALSDAGLQALQKTPYKDTYFIHNSGAYIPARVDSGRISLSFDVLLGRETPGILDVVLRDTRKPEWVTFGALQVAPGGVRFNEQPVAGLSPGEWHHVELVFFLGQARGECFVRVVGPDGSENRRNVAVASGADTALTWMGLLANASTAGILHVDNLAVNRKDNGIEEWPIREDFEDYAPGQVYGTVIGANAELGGDVFVSDAAAASGKNSLEIRDAQGLGESWKPMVRLGVNSTVAGAVYCPMLGQSVPENGRVFRSVNWGLVPQLKTIHRSPLLYYVQTRDVGDGIIEVTYVVHNFSVRDDIVFDWLNAPWGGTRVTSLPFHYVSSPTGELWDLQKIEELNIKNGRGVRKTGGWNLSCASEDDASPSLALVFGRDRHLDSQREKAKKGEPCFQYDESIYRDWTSRVPGWEKFAEHAWRNYDVAVVIPRFRLTPGASIWYRSFLVVNRKDRAIAQAKSLVDKVDYGVRVFDREGTPMIPVGGENPNIGFELYAHPVPGAVPLFLVENQSTGQEVITSDPYIFVPQEQLSLEVNAAHPKADYYRKAVGYSLDENNSRWKSLLGYGLREKPSSGNWARLSTLLGNAHFPAANVHHLDLWVHLPGADGE